MSAIKHKIGGNFYKNLHKKCWVCQKKIIISNDFFNNTVLDRNKQKNFYFLEKTYSVKIAHQMKVDPTFNSLYDYIS